MELAGKHVVVTGAASGIGRACATRFAPRAPAWSSADRDEARVRAVADEIGALAVAADVGREADIVALIAAAQDRHGPIDLFFSNAGVPGPRRRPRGPRRRAPAHLGDQRHGARVGGPGAAARLGGARRGLPAQHGVGGRAADPGLGAGLLHHQARRRRARRVAVDHLRRRRHQGLLPVPAGRPHARCSTSRSRIPIGARRCWPAGCSSPRMSPPRSWPACATSASSSSLTRTWPTTWRSRALSPSAG